MAAVVTIVIIPVIVKGLSKMVPWEKYGCEVVGTAEDGLEGLELIRQLRPHIIISDIYMPKMDGLAMAAAMKLQKDDKTEKYKKETFFIYKELKTDRNSFFTDTYSAFMKSMV